ncbi:MAG: hypothetical protein HQ474_01645 [Flammeovirgaceae bacterium]|nr:hypothetical protein [Flammeovirgaceae bacterium]
MKDLPRDIRLWFLTAPLETGLLSQDIPLPVSHDALKLGLVRDVDGTWMLTASGRGILNQLLND